MHDKLKEIDFKELELPDTTFIRDVESRVFQSIALQCLAKVEGISLLEGTFFDSLLGREVENVKGIYVEQDQKRHSVNIRVEINIFYGLSIPEKAEEIQFKIVKEISNLTGLHVASVHVIFKDLIVKQKNKERITQEEKEDIKLLDEEYSEEF
jgi:uncharacterized alkaline shock family protein YloU